MCARRDVDESDDFYGWCRLCIDASLPPEVVRLDEARSDRRRTLGASRNRQWRARAAVARAA